MKALTQEEFQNAIDGVTARIEMEVLRLHLKIRRYDKAAGARIAYLEKRVAEIDTPDGGAK